MFNKMHSYSTTKRGPNPRIYRV